MKKLLLVLAFCSTALGQTFRQDQIKYTGWITDTLNTRVNLSDSILYTTRHYADSSFGTKVNYLDSTTVFFTPTQALAKVNYSDTGSALVSSASKTGFLKYSDWSLFNSKQPGGTYLVPSDTTYLHNQVGLKLNKSDSTTYSSRWHADSALGTKLIKTSVTVSGVGVATGLTAINNGADFGPDTPGTTTSGIQEAINAIGVAGGGTVCLLPDTFKVASYIVSNGYPSITLEGSGNRSIIYPAVGYNTGNFVISITDSNWTLKSFEVNAVNQTGGAKPTIQVVSPAVGCLLFDLSVRNGDHGELNISGNRQRIIGCRLFNAKDDNIIVSGTDITVADCVCNGTQVHNNISLVDATNITVVGNVCLNSASKGIAFENISGLECSGCMITSNIVDSASNGIYVYSANAGVEAIRNSTISDNTISNCTSGISFGSGLYITVANNKIKHPSSLSSGAGIVTPASPGAYFSISGNTIFDCRSSAALAVGAPYSTVVGNTIYDTAAAATNAIQISGSYITVVGNTVNIPSASGGIYVLGSVHNIQINNNIISSWDRCLRIGSGVTYLTAMSNSFRDSTGLWVEMFGSPSPDYITLIGNTVNSSFTITGAHTILKDNPGYNPQPASSITAGTSPYTFPGLPYDASYVLTTAGGITALTLDGQVITTTAGIPIFVPAQHTLIATWATTAPVFQILPQ